MSKDMVWELFESGNTLGQSGSEGGVIIRDEMIQGKSRITLERGSPTAPFAITCGIYGWLVHTRYFANQLQANFAIWRMKHELQKIVALIPFKTKVVATELEADISKRLERFVKNFP